MSGVVEVAALQLPAEPGEVAGNRDRFVRAVRDLAGPVDLIVTPELSITGYDLALIDERGAELAEPLDGPSVGAAVELAAERDATIVLGLLERAPDGLYDTAAIVTPDGRVTGYRKSHLYPPETLRLRAGDELRPVATPVAALGPLICFEHAFPAIATTLALAGAQILVIPSAVPVGYEYLLELRSRARAQDNQVFVVACNLAGYGFCGRSLIADPRGAVLASAGAEPAVLRARLDLSVIADERSREPALHMHRPDLYEHAAGGSARVQPVDGD
jgi:predicted amidohydrolase